MKKLITLALTLLALSGTSQVWQSIGTSVGTNVSSCDLAIDQSNGEIFVGYVETGTQRANVRKWNGTSWVLVGTANFGTGAVMTGVKIAVHNGVPYVATRYDTGGGTFLRVYFWTGTVWDAMGSVAYQTPPDGDFSLKMSNSGNAFLCFNNMTASVGSTDLITLMLSATSQGQIGGAVTDSYGDNHDFVLDLNEDPIVVHEYGDMSNYVNLTTVNSPFYDVQDVILNDFSGKIVTNLVGATDLRFAAIDDDVTPSLVYTRYDVGTGLFAVPFSIFTGGPEDYYMASGASLDYFFYTNGTNSYAESVSMSGVQASLGTNFIPGTGQLSSPSNATWNDRVVVACVRNSVVRIMELDNPCVLTLGNSFGGCEQILNTAPSPSVTIDDNNYIHSNLILTVASTDPGTIPSSNVSLIGTFPTYYVQFTSLDVATTTSVELEFETQESGVWTNYMVYFVDVVPTPNVVLSLPNDEVCENNGLLNLLPYGSPAGGFWSGPGVNSATGKFNPNVANPGTHTINYTYNDSYGCTNDDNTTITVHAVPQVTVVPTAATCGAEDGAVNATITGGTPGYTIYWSNGSSTEDLVDVAPGIYFINVTDAEGCEATQPASVTSSGLTLSASVSDVVCPGASSGSIDLTAISGSGIASIEWSNGATTEDVSGLSAGTYEVTVTASDGCVSTASYTVNSPAPMTFTASTVSATCASTDGSATCNVSGGTAPYNFQWFQAISGSPIGTNSPTISGFGGGGYFAIVTDDNGCSAIHNTMISEIGGPEVLIASVIPAGCTDDGAISISINTDQPVALIEWSNGMTLEDISGLPAGFYTVEVTDQLGCVGMGGVEVPAAAPDLIPVCLVTVDTSTNTNLLVWEKPISTDIDHFNIYRETSVAGEFLFIASVPYADESIYNDLVASPQVRSWRYKITAVNPCGEESDFSEFHKTIHLTINLGLGSTINLNWDEYEGFAFTTYDLYRHTNSAGWQLIQSLPSTNFSFTDSPPTFNGLDYIISVTPPDICTSTLKAQDHNSSRSNKTSSITGDLVGLEETDATGMTTVYPNPSASEFHLVVNPDLATTFDIVITDAQGRIVTQLSSTNSELVIDLSSFSDGIYNLQILAGDQVINYKLVKQ